VCVVYTCSCWLICTDIFFTTYSLKSELAECKSSRDSAKEECQRLVAGMKEEVKTALDDRARLENKVKMLFSANQSYERQVTFQFSDVGLHLTICLTSGGGEQVKRLREERARMVAERENNNNVDVPTKKRQLAVSKSRQSRQVLELDDTDEDDDDPSFSFSVVEDETQLEIEDPAAEGESLALPGQYALSKPSRLFKTPGSTKPGVLPLAELVNKKALVFGEKKKRRIG
jgi:hypothetical protein